MLIDQELRIDKNGLVGEKAVWFFHDYEACIHKTIENKKKTYVWKLINGNGIG